MTMKGTEGVERWKSTATLKRQLRGGSYNLANSSHRRASSSERRLRYARKYFVKPLDPLCPFSIFP